MATTGDPYVLNVQKWLNETYGNDSRFKTVTENGKTGWNTIYALTRALQIRLGIQSTADNFGNGTINAFNKQFPNGVQEQTEDSDPDNIYGIIQGALICKGYSIGASKPTCYFLGGTGAAIKKLKSDAGVDNTSSTVTLNIMKALLSMDYFYSYDTSEKTQKIISMQRYLNRNYESYIGIKPCDGVYSRSTSQAMTKALQAEEGLSPSEANGNFGPATKRCLPTILADGTGSGTNYKGKSYTTENINKFKILANIALYLNGFGDGELTSNLNVNSIKDFQSHHAISVTGNVDYTTWLSLYISCGNQDRSAIACDCITKITEDNVNVLKNNNYKYIGRYLNNVEGGIDKELSKEELGVLFNNGIRLFPIQQRSAKTASYFTSENAKIDAKKAFDSIEGFKLQFGSIIYFAVDYDATDAEITSKILPYFKVLVESFMNMCGGKYRVGVYGTRNLCSRVCKAGYAVSSFVSDMSTGYSGNLGFKLPENWAFDQFATTDITHNGTKINIDKDGFSGRYTGISQEYSEFGMDTTDILTGSTRTLINMTQTSVPVYEEKKPQPEATTPLYTTGGKIVGYIKPYDFYIRYQVAHPHQDNVHRVMFNDGTDVKLGYITEKLEFPSSTISPTNDNAIRAQILNGHDTYTYVEYIPSTNSYKLHDYNNTLSRDIYINKSVPYFDANGNYVGMLNKGDYIKINRANSQMPGKTRPWTNYIDGIKFNGEKDFNNFKGFVSLGLEYGSSGSDRAWY